MKSKNNRARFHLFLTAIALAVGTTACSLPNQTATKAAAIASKPFSSGEILHVLHTLNNAEIAQSELAMSRSGSDEVRRTAQLLVRDHTASNRRLETLTQALGVQMDQSPLSKGMQLQANEIKENLSKLSGPNFDCVYLRKQVEQHQLAVDTINSQLLPAAQHPQIKELLTTASAHLQQHRQVAQNSRAGLPQCPAT